MDDRGERQPRERRVMDHLMRMHRAHHRVIERMVSGLGVHGGQHRILMMLSRHEKMPTQKEIACRMDITAASVANMLKRLESGGYIARSAGCADGRCNEVEITEQGRRIVEDSCRIFETIDRQMFEGFSNEEIETLKGYLERIHSNLHAMEEEPDRCECLQEEKEVLKP